MVVNVKGKYVCGKFVVNMLWQMFFQFSILKIIYHPKKLTHIHHVIHLPYIWSILRTSGFILLDSTITNYKIMIVGLSPQPKFRLNTM